MYADAKYEEKNLSPLGKCLKYEARSEKRFNLLHIYYHVRRNKIGLQDKTNHEKEIGVTH